MPEEDVVTLDDLNTFEELRKKIAAGKQKARAKKADLFNELLCLNTKDVYDEIVTVAAMGGKGSVIATIDAPEGSANSGTRIRAHLTVQRPSTEEAAAKEAA